MRHDLLVKSGSPRLVGFGTNVEEAAAADVDAELLADADASVGASAAAPGMASSALAWAREQQAV